MIVRTLIEMLMTLPSDLPVLIEDNSREGLNDATPLQSVRFSEKAIMLSSQEINPLCELLD